MRFGPGIAAALFFAVLMAAPNPCSAQFVTFVRAPHAVGAPSASSLFERHVAVVWLNVVRQGRTQMIHFTADQLAGLPDIAVDGYINGVVLLSTAPLTASVARQPMGPIRQSGDGFFNLKYFGYLSRHQFWSTFMTIQPEPAGIQGYYAQFSKVPGDALCRDPEFRITVARDGREAHLTIRQRVRTPIETDNLASGGTRTPDCFYLGDDPAWSQDMADGFRPRLQAILNGVRAVESAAGMTIVDRVNLIEYQELYNAYTCEDEADIWFYSPLFWQESVAELNTIAEHETMHILGDRLGFPVSSRLRERFAALMGYPLFSSSRFAVVTTGRPPADEAGSRRSLLFEFINEINFFRGMKGGHAQDDMDEFCASFLHSLMYIERLHGLLGRPIKTGHGFHAALSLEEQARLIDDYQAILATLIDEASGPLPDRLANLFTSGMAIVRQIKADLDTRRIASASQTPHPS